MAAEKVWEVYLPSLARGGIETEQWPWAGGSSGERLAVGTDPLSGHLTALQVAESLQCAWTESCCGRELLLTSTGEELGVARKLQVGSCIGGHAKPT